MGRRPAYPPLRVHLNNLRVGTLTREASGAISFSYHADWLASDRAQPVSLSMPLRETPYRGETVTAVFENLLPDSTRIRQQVAERVGARGSDAFSLLSVIGRDCVGALQFVAGDDVAEDATGAISGEVVDDAAIEKLLLGLARAPLGLQRDDDFRISVAGAQEKTALLRDEGKWLRPHGTTPTTHIFKTRIGRLPGGIDLSDSVENEFFCLKLVGAFGLPVTGAEIMTFGATKALVIERFDRRRTDDGRLIRLPQEDCCQALSVQPGLKYQSDGGPGMLAVLDLLAGSDTPLADRETFLKAQIVFWLIGANDGHAKNFSLHLGRRGTFSLTPLYDILTVQPALVQGTIERKQMKMAMSVGDNRHYRFDQIHGRHFVQTALRAGLSKQRAERILDEMAERAPTAFADTCAALDAEIPRSLIEAVGAGIEARRSSLRLKGND